VPHLRHDSGALLDLICSHIEFLATAPSQFFFVAASSVAFVLMFDSSRNDNVAEELRIEDDRDFFRDDRSNQ
jgi:hypothetical protein